MSSNRVISGWLRRAEKLLTNGELKGADALFSDALKKDKKSVTALRGRANVAQASGSNEHAKKFFQLANKQEAENYCVEADKAFEDASFQHAIVCYKKSLNILDDNLDAIWGLAECFASIDEKRNAARWYRRYLELEPNEPEALHMLSAMGSIQTPTRASEGYITTLFDRFAPDFDELLNGELDYQVPNILAETMEVYFQGRNIDIEILDLGCGTGLSGVAFKKFARRIDGVDLSGKMLKKAGDRSIYNTLSKSDIISHLGSTDKSYDLVLGADVFVYFGVLEDLFLGIIKILKKGGFMAFSLESREGKDFELRPSGRYAHGRPYVREIAENAGFIECSVKKETLRLECGEPVVGDIWVFKT